jgi:hypothetical protein
MEPAAREPLLSPAAAETEIRSDTGRQKAKDTFWPCVANLSKVIIGAGVLQPCVCWLQSRACKGDADLAHVFCCAHVHQTPWKQMGRCLNSVILQDAPCMYDQLMSLQAIVAASPTSTTTPAVLCSFSCCFSLADDNGPIPSWLRDDGHSTRSVSTSYCPLCFQADRLQHTEKHALFPWPQQQHPQR